MTSRSIIYTGSQPRSVDILQGWKNALIGDGMLAYVLGGTCGGSPNTTMKGFAATATNPPSMTVNIGPGVMFSPAVVDLSAYSTLGTDTTHSITKSGINLDVTPVSFTAPTTVGTSQIFVIQGQVQTVDSGNATLQYFDSENPGVVYNGPNNTGTSQPTQRNDVCAISVVVGVSGASPAVPSVQSNWTGLWIITIPAGATSISQSMIARFPNASFLDKSLCDLQNVSGGGGAGTVTSITAGLGLTGGTITTSGTIALASTGVAAGSYTNANLTVNAQGQITSVSNGATGGGGAGTVTSVTAGAGLSGGTITTTGTISMPTVVAPGTYTNANITIDAFGRVTAASTGSSAGTNYQPQIDTINGQITTINGEITTINGQITTIQNNQTTHNTQITTLQNNVATLNSEYTTQNTSITTINGVLNGPKIRYRLQSTLNIAVNSSTGNDATATAAISGPTPTPSATPFKTMQAAWNTIINAYDVSGVTVNFNCTGSFTAGITATGMVGNTQTGSVNIIGNTSSPTSCPINVTGGNCFTIGTSVNVNISGFYLNATVGGANTGIGIFGLGGTVFFSYMNFGTCGASHIVGFGSSNINALAGTSYTVSGNANSHVYVITNNGFSSVQSTCLISGTPAFSDSFYKVQGGYCQTFQTEYSTTQGNAQGLRYNVYANGILNNLGVDPDNGPATGNGQVLPGNQNGITATGGQII